MRSSFRAIGSIAVLAAVTLALVCVLGLYWPGTWSQSPVSPLPPTLQWVLPTTAVSPVFPSSPSVSIQRLFSSPVWLSPLPWIGLGVVAFGLLAWALYALVNRLDPGNK